MTNDTVNKTLETFNSISSILPITQSPLNNSAALLITVYLEVYDDFAGITQQLNRIS